MKRKEKMELLKSELIYQAIKMETINTLPDFVIKKASRLLMEEDHPGASYFEIFEQLVSALETAKMMEAIRIELVEINHDEAVANSKQMSKIFMSRKAQLSAKIKIFRPIILNLMTQQMTEVTKDLFSSPLYSKYLKRTTDIDETMPPYLD